jgi:hypothetical protein
MSDIPEFELARRLLLVMRDMADEVSPGQGLPYSVIYAALHFVQLHFDGQVLNDISKPMISEQEIEDDEVE